MSRPDATFQYLGLILHELHGFISCPDRVGDETEVDERGFVSVAFFNLSSRGCVGNNSYLEAPLEQCAHMGFGTKVR